MDVWSVQEKESNGFAWSLEQILILALAMKHSRGSRFGNLRPKGRIGIAAAVVVGVVKLKRGSVAAFGSEREKHEKRWFCGFHLDLGTVCHRGTGKRSQPSFLTFNLWLKRSKPIRILLFVNFEHKKRSQRSKRINRWICGLCKKKKRFHLDLGTGKKKQPWFF